MEIPTYRPRDTVTLELDLRDESGVGSVDVICTNERGNHRILFRGNGEGQQQVSLTLTYEVPEHIQSAEYSVTYVEARDTLGNSVVHQRSDIKFRIEAPEGDFKGPDLMNAQLS